MLKSSCYQIALLGSATFVMLAPAGCGSSGMSKSEVSGKVTLQGKPVPGVLVCFTPEQGPSATGKTDTDGYYTLSTEDPGDGAVIGHHRVTISQPQPGMILEKGKPPRMPPPLKIIIPPMLADPTSSNLTADVVDGDNTIDFPL